MDSKNTDFSFDLAGLILSVWKRKILLFLFIIAVMGCTALYYHTRPFVTTAVATVKVGKIAHIKLESYPDIMAYINSAIASRPDDGVQISAAVSRFNMYSPDDLYGTLLLDISAQSADSSKVRSALEDFLKPIIERHKKLYDTAMKSIKPSGSAINSERAALFFIESYTFPTTLEGSIRMSQMRTGFRNASGLGRGLSFYLFLSFMVSIVLGSSGIIAFDYLSAEVRRRSA